MAVNPVIQYLLAALFIIALVLVLTKIGIIDPQIAIESYKSYLKMMATIKNG